MTETNNSRNTGVTLDQIKRDAKKYKAAHRGVSLSDAQHIIARQLGYRDFPHARAELERGRPSGRNESTAISASRPSPEFLYPQVPAVIRSDDERREAYFDAAPWFAQANDDAVLRLLKDGLHNSWASDAVADAAASYAPQIRRLFDYLARINGNGGDESAPGLVVAEPGGHETVGSTVTIDEQSVHEWLQRHRPALLSAWPPRERWTAEEVELPPSLMSPQTLREAAAKLDVSAREDAAHPGRWAWFVDSEVGGTNFASEEDALRDVLSNL